MTQPTDLRFVGPATAETLADSEWSAADVAAGGVTYDRLVAAGVNPGVAARIRREHSLPWSNEGGDLDRRSEQVWGLEDGEREWVAAATDDGVVGGDGRDDDGRADADTDEEAAWRESGVAAEDDETDPTTAEAAWREAADDWAGAADDADGAGETAWRARATGGDDCGAGAVETDTEADASGDDDATAVAGERAWRERSAPTPVETLDAVDADAAEALADAGITSVRSLATADPDLVADLLGRDREAVAAWRDAARDAAE
ncbi:MAG: helix-hairpin-helix domain-containing protein [Halolamina sp.]